MKQNEFNESIWGFHEVTWQKHPVDNLNLHELRAAFLELLTAPWLPQHQKRAQAEATSSFLAGLMLGMLAGALLASLAISLVF
jgi:hypothetical protein